MADITNVKNLIINKVESQTVFDYMKSNGLVSEDELYLVQGENAAVLYTAQELTEEQMAQVRANIGAVSNDDVQVIVDGLGSLASKDKAALGDLDEDVRGAITAAQDTANAALPKSGGTMTGDLILASDPTSDEQAVTKRYADRILVDGVDYITLTFDGNIQGKEYVTVYESTVGSTVSNGYYFVKVSSDVPEDVAMMCDTSMTAAVKISSEISATETKTISRTDIVESENGIYSIGENGVIVVPNDFVDTDGKSFTRGIYFACFVSNLESLSSYTSSWEYGVRGSLNKINMDFLPRNVVNRTYLEKYVDNAIGAAIGGSY